MDTGKVNDWIQILGAAGIIASLVFVGMQLKQSQEIAIAAQYQARHDAAAENIRVYLQSEITLRFLGQKIKGVALSHPSLPDDVRERVRQLSPEEMAARFFQARLDLMTLDNLHFQYQSGFLSDEAWVARLTEFKWAVVEEVPRSRVRLQFESNPTLFRQSFRELLEDVFAEIDSEARTASQ